MAPVTRLVSKTRLPAWPTSPSPSARSTIRGRWLNSSLKVMPSLVGIVVVNTHYFPYQEGISATGPGYSAAL